MDESFQQQLRERFAQLPASVQAAITSADVEAHLRQLADAHQLHVDQWEKLENEVQVTLLGFERPEELAANIQKNVGVSAEISAELAQDISSVVFAPIRSELERILEHPAAQAAAQTGVDAARAQLLSGDASKAPEQKVARGQISEAYKPQTLSRDRRSVDGDPYREPIA